jgi:hypothetical protein
MEFEGLPPNLGLAGACEIYPSWFRSGYLTEAADRGAPLAEAMEPSRHRSVQQASS